MWLRYARTNEGDTLGRDDWFVIRTEEAGDGPVTLVLVDWAAGDRPDVTRAQMDVQAALEMAGEIRDGLIAEGWRLAPLSR